jgi:hypothetical protein
VIRALLAVAVLLAVAAPATAAPRCFGAASRDAEVPCHNPRLRHRVTPTPDRALLTPNVDCAEGVEQALASCGYGAEDPSATVALLGDSHAAHWRAALEVVAIAMDWHVDEFAAPHCPFSTAEPDSGPGVAEGCRQLNADIVDWLSAHPDVRTVFVSAHTRAPVKTAGGRTEFQTRVEGFTEQWARLPASVQRVVVLRDTPLDRISTFDCVRKAMRRHRRAGAACTVDKRFALSRDAEVAAARAAQRAVSVIALDHQFCGSFFCFPVVGGVLTHKDKDHLGQLFARTLGPILLRRVRNLALGYGLQP